MAVVFVFVAVILSIFRTLTVSDDAFCYHTACFLCPTDDGEPFVDIDCTYHTICVPFGTVLWSAAIVNTAVSVSTPAPAAYMFNVDFVLYWARPYAHATPFQPKNCRSMPSSVIALLLLLSGSVHVNPGPPIRFATLNIRSARNKAAVLHDLIADHDLDIVALCETWIRKDDPPAIADDIAPEGFSVVHVLRPAKSTMSRNVGGGLAVVARDALGLRQRRLPAASRSTLEAQLVN